jgi:hypothetical protein
MGNSTHGFTLIKASTPFIEGTDLWHIILASVAAGCGLAIAFGLILLGTEYGQTAKDGLGKAAGWLLGLLAAAFCIGAVVIGIYVMANPPKSKPLKVVPSGSASSMVTPHHSTARHRAAV